MHHALAVFEMPGLPSMLVIGAIGLLIFGKRLPEIGKSLGKGIVEFKKGLNGIGDEINSQANAPALMGDAKPQFAPPQQQQYGQPVQAAQPQYAPPQYVPPVAAQQPPQYKFDPYTGKPIESDSQTPPTI